MFWTKPKGLFQINCEFMFNSCYISKRIIGPDDTCGGDIRAWTVSFDKALRHGLMSVFDLMATLTQVHYLIYSYWRRCITRYAVTRTIDTRHKRLFVLCNPTLTHFYPNFTQKIIPPFNSQSQILLQTTARLSVIPIPLSGSISLNYLVISSEIPILLSGSISLNNLAVSSAVRLDYHSVVPFLWWQQRWIGSLVFCAGVGQMPLIHMCCNRTFDPLWCYPESCRTGCGYATYRRCSFTV